MPFFEILRAGKVIKRVEVTRAKAVAGCSIRVGSAGKAVLKLGESTRVGDFDVRLVEDSAVGELSGSKPSGPVPRLEGYDIQHQLGEGGMGTVWQGIQLSTKRSVAIKFLSTRAFESERAQRRFVREVELSAKLEHPNIARIYDSGLRHGAYYYAMELVQGVSLDKYVEDNKLSPAQILSIMRTVCQAIQHAHQRGVVHRDLKPTNIMVDTNGQPRVVDFGLAKSLQVDETEKQMTVSIEGNAAGTPAYMSPEQAIGRIEEIDSRSDIYSIGVILYRLLVGQPPIDLSGSRFEVMQRIVRNEIRAPRQFNKSINADLEGLLRKCLALKPEDRYASAADLADDIDNYLVGRPLRARKATPIYLLGKRLAQHRKAVVASVAGGVLALSVVIGLLPNGWLRKSLSETKFVNIFHEKVVKEIVAPATQPATEPVARGVLEDAVPFQSQSDVLWEQVTDLDRNQGIGEKLNAAEAERLSAKTFFDKGLYDSAAVSYKKSIKLCVEIQSFNDARQKAVAARESWQKLADAARKAGIDTSAAVVWTQVQANDAQANDRLESGDFAAALASWETAADTIEKEIARHTATTQLTVASTAPTTEPNDVIHPTPFIAGKFGNALQFDGTSDYADMGDPQDHHLDLGPAATLESWVRFDALPADGTFATFISKDQGVGHQNKWAFGYAANYGGLKNRLILRIGFGTTPHPDELLRSDTWVPVPGTWYHIALAKTGNGYTFYRDGVACGRMVGVYDAPRVDHSLALGEAETGSRFCGAIDEVRIWNIARTAGDIQANMNRELLGSEPGLVGYWQFNEPNGTSIHSRSISDEVGLFYGTHGLAGGPESSQPFDLDTGLVFRFSCDKPDINGVIKDESPMGNDGQVKGAKWNAHGPGSHGAYTFSAADKTDAIVVPDSSSLNPQQITEAAWIRTSTSDKWWRRIIHKDFRRGYVLSMNGGPDGSPTRGRALMQFGAGAAQALITDQFCADGAWHFVAGTYDGVRARLYVDGRPCGSLSFSGRVTANSSPLILGNAVDADAGPTENGVPGSSAFDGDISEVRIYNRPLSPEEIVALRNSTLLKFDLNKGLVLHFSFKTSADDGVVKDESGNGNNGQLSGAKWVPDGPGRGAYLFTAANRTDAIVVPDSASLNPQQITESAWVKTKTVDKWWHRIIDKTYATAYDLAECGDHNRTDTSLRGKAIMNIGNGDNHRALSDQSIADGKWHHLASTYDGAKEKLYVDGKEQRSENAWNGRVSGNADPLRIGNGDPSYKLRDGTPDVTAFDGEISDVRVYNRALSAEEIVAVKESALLSAPTTQASGDLLAVQADQPSGFEISDTDGTRLTWSRSESVWSQHSSDGKVRGFKIVERSTVANHKGTIIQALDKADSLLFIPDRNSGSSSLFSKDGSAPWLSVGTMQNVK